MQDITLSANFRRYHATDCEPTTNQTNNNPLDTWDLYAEYSNVAGPANKRANGYLTFASGASVPGAATVVEARLVLAHASTTTGASVAIYGGTPQPIFGSTVSSADFTTGNLLLDVETMTAITQQGYADFTIQVDQIHKTNRTQFRLSLVQTCPFPNDPDGWVMHSPTAPAAANRPTLHVTYQLP